jgi:glycosyltransferase involved in cell wall biosynthesis
MHIGLITRSQTDYVLDLANSFQAKGEAVTLYLDHLETLEEIGNSEHPVEDIFRAGLVPKTCQIRLLRPPRMRDLHSLAFFVRLAETMRSDGIEVLHLLLNPGEIWLAFLAWIIKDIPVVTTIIVPIANTGERLPARVVWGTNKLAALGSEMVIVNGESQVEIVRRIYGVSTDRIAHVPLTMHTRAAQWRKRSVLEEPATILFFGRAHPQKGLEYLVKAQPLITQKVPETRILISAHGDDLERCRKMIRDHSKFEITEAVVPGDLMATFFQRAALVVLPYISASTSGVLVTAYSFGKPVVASRVGCLNEYVVDGITGLLVRPMDVEELADAIVRLLLDTNLRHRMGMNAENWIMARERHSIEQTLDVYRKAILMKSPLN